MVFNRDRGIVMALLWEYISSSFCSSWPFGFFGVPMYRWRRVIKEKKEIPQGLWLSMGMGIGSLAFGVLTIFVPDILLEILVGILAVIVGIIGFGFLLDGYGLRNVEHIMKEQTEKPAIT